MEIGPLPRFTIELDTFFPRIQQSSAHISSDFFSSFVLLSSKSPAQSSVLKVFTHSSRETLEASYIFFPSLRSTLEEKRDTYGLHFTRSWDTNHIISLWHVMLRSRTISRYISHMREKVRVRHFRDRKKDIRRQTKRRREKRSHRVQTWCTYVHFLRRSSLPSPTLPNSVPPC